MRRLQEKLDEANAAFKQLIDSKGEEVTAIKRRLAEIKKDVPEDVMEMYIKRRNGKKCLRSCRSIRNSRRADAASSFWTTLLKICKIRATWWNVRVAADWFI